MCGLFAVIPTADLTPEMKLKLKNLFIHLGLKNDRRGGHSHGIWGKGWLPIRKLGEVGDKDGIQSMSTLMKAWKVEKDDWVAGHTRFATHGGKTVENAHPFTVGNITLAHNGVVYVTSTDSEVNRHPVDSGKLATLMSKIGVVEAIAQTSGSCGLLFHDETRKLRMYRGSQQLSVAHNPEWGYAVSSDKDHLRDALGFAGLEAKIQEVDTHKVVAPWEVGFQPVPAPMKSWSSSYGGSYDWRSFGGRSFPYDGYDDSYEGFYGSGRTHYSERPDTKPVSRVYNQKSQRWEEVNVTHASTITLKEVLEADPKQLNKSKEIDLLALIESLPVPDIPEKPQYHFFMDSLVVAKWSPMLSVWNAWAPNEPEYNRLLQEYLTNRGVGPGEMARQISDYRKGKNVSVTVLTPPSDKDTQPLPKVKTAEELGLVKVTNLDVFTAALDRGLDPEEAALLASRASKERQYLDDMTGRRCELCGEAPIDPATGGCTATSITDDLVYAICGDCATTFKDDLVAGSIVPIKDAKEPSNVSFLRPKGGRKTRAEVTAAAKLRSLSQAAGQK